MNRRKEREQIFILLFENTINKDVMEEIIENACSYREFEINDYIKDISKDISNTYDHLDEMISKYSRNWDKVRISKVALSLLRLSLYEILFIENIPIGVSINEAVELAKKYGGEDDSAFINGILGTISKDLEKNKNLLQNTSQE
jgi:transcription antitermination factor NusB